MSRQSKRESGRPTLRGPVENKVLTRDKFVLYHAAVQSIDVELAFMAKAYRTRNQERFHLLREDFCAAGALACEFVRRHPENRAWGVDIDRPTLDWGRANYLSRLGSAAGRLTYVHADVRSVTRPRVDLIAALNFSYWLFTDRAELLGYFRSVRESLRPGGLLVLDTFGGSDAMQPLVEERGINGAIGPAGERLRSFSYVWEQEKFNPVDHRMVCHIHFKLRDGSQLHRAFTYHWRLWTMPELRDMLLEAGFAGVDVWADGWDEDTEESDGVYRRRSAIDNDPGWLAYVVGYRDPAKKG